jgi:two-component sensor histidine kinase
MEEPYRHQISLLFVEDNEPIRVLFERRLSKRVQRFFVAENGHKGLEMYKAHKPDLVITDISMPIMNGLDMIKKIKEFDPDVNVIVMSAYSIKEYFLEAINLGVNGYLVKPVDPKKLYALIDELSGNILMGKALEEKELIRSIAESNLKKSLAEKEILLKEVHHRVKNNMQIISSILKMQERLIDDPKLKTVLGESQNRIRSMALIHENLYRNETLANINFGNYVKSLTSNLSRTYADHQGRIVFEFDMDENVFLPIDIGIPCGLIINELISNAFKHAFKGREQGKISISLAVENGNEYILRVGDDGIGMKETATIEKSGSLGMRIVSKLIQQIEGKLEYDFNGGTKYIIRFKE